MQSDGLGNGDAQPAAGGGAWLADHDVDIAPERGQQPQQPFQRVFAEISPEQPGDVRLGAVIALQGVGVKLEVAVIGAVSSPARGGCRPALEGAGLPPLPHALHAVEGVPLRPRTRAA